MFVESVLVRKIDLCKVIETSIAGVQNHCRPRRFCNPVYVKTPSIPSSQDSMTAETCEEFLRNPTIENYTSEDMLQEVYEMSPPQFLTRYDRGGWSPLSEVMTSGPCMMGATAVAPDISSLHRSHRTVPRCGNSANRGKPLAYIRFLRYGTPRSMPTINDNRN